MICIVPEDMQLQWFKDHTMLWCYQGWIQLKLEVVRTKIYTDNGNYLGASGRMWLLSCSARNRKNPEIPQLHSLSASAHPLSEWAALLSLYYLSTCQQPDPHLAGREFPLSLEDDGKFFRKVMRFPSPSWMSLRKLQLFLGEKEFVFGWWGHSSWPLLWVLPDFSHSQLLHPGASSSVVFNIF